MASNIDIDGETRWFGDSRFRTLHDGDAFDLQESVQPAGTQTPLHRHTAYEEHLFVLDGEAEAWVDERHVRLRAGDALTIPLGAPHTIRAGSGGVHGLVSSRPGRFARLMARVGTAAPAPPDVEAFARAAAEIGDELLGPPGALPHRSDGS